MRAALVYVALALVVVCGCAVVRANDVTAAESEAMEENVSAEDFDSMPFVPRDSEHDEIDADSAAVDAVEQSEVSDTESDVSDVLEGNTEFDAALLQTADEKVTNGKAKAKAKTIAVKVKKTAKKAAKKAVKKAKKAAKKAKRFGARKAKRFPRKSRHSRHPRRLRAPKVLKSKSKPWKFHPERVRAVSTKPTDPELEKLDLALAAVKEDILATNKQITDERKWVIAVAKIIAAYNHKMKRVEAHIIALRKEMKSLYRKKKQIENLKLQRALKAKLKEAKAELSTLISSLKHVAVKRGELNKSGVALRNTISGIEAQLRKLRGQSQRKRHGKRHGRKGKRHGRKGKRHGRKGKRHGKGRRHGRKGKRAHKRV